MLYPDYRFRRVFDIPVDFLLERGLTHLVLDVDNTLATNEHPVPSDGVGGWLAALDAAGIRAAILSNNSDARVRPFAATLGLPYVAYGKKPLRGGFERCRGLFGCERRRMAVVGDQLLTDILGGLRYGIATILVEPIEPEDLFFFKLKRAAERAILRRYDARR